MNILQFSCFVFFLGSNIINCSFANSQLVHCDATQEKPCIVQDTEPFDKPVKNLRSGLMIAEYYQGNLYGIDKFYVSASAQPHESGWQVIADYIGKQPSTTPSQIFVIDLRQENHGYLNGNAITLCNLHNWVNLGKSKDQVLSYERTWLNELALFGHIANILSIDEFARQDYAAGKELDVESVHSEAELVKKAGFHYVRLTVTDHRSPLPTEVDAFVDLVSSLPANSWLHIHCRGGKGRSITFMAMLDMLNNADKVTFDEIMARQAAIPPFYDLTQIVRDGSELTPYYFERLIFLGEFYDYALQRLAGNSQSWSEWKGSAFSTIMPLSGLVHYIKLRKP